MAKAYPYFKWYPKDAEADEKYAAMTDAELGFFHRCLNRSWMNEGLPADAEERWLVLKTPPEIAAKLWRRVSRSFVPSELFPGKLVNPRQEIERAIATSNSEKNKRNAEKRWHKPDAKGDAVALRSQSGEVTCIPPPTPQKPENEISDSQLREIEEAYERHLKHANREPRDLVIQQVLSMNGKFDWNKFRARHAAYCAHYAEKGWRFCTVTFLGWINAGMPPAPPQETTTKSAKKETGVEQMINLARKRISQGRSPL